MKFVDTPYVSFLDSDDWLMPQYVEKIAYYVEQNRNVEIIMVLPQIFHEGSRVVKAWYDKPLFEQIFPENGYIINPSECPGVYRLEVNFCRKIYKTEFVRAIRFEFREKIKWEDVHPHFYLLSSCTSCMGIGEVGFYYRIGGNNQITASRGADRLDLLYVFDDLLRFLADTENKQLYYPVMRVMVRFSIWCIRMSDTDTRRVLVEKLHDLFKKLPIAYCRALKKGVGENCSRSDAIQYLLFLTAIRCKGSNFIFYDYLWQEIGEKVIKKFLRTGERVE